MEKLAYRPDVEGLRAVAVLAVIAAHIPEKILPSGFLGVDVFFAISGFVVTASLLSQHRKQSTSGSVPWRSAPTAGWNGRGSCRKSSR